ncbi:hypothetical protein G6F70_006238 [Rhizopus microsporus]|nr:hypothetical protein G6F71_001870 [Rhizopus microsporus]KAG1197916.1 hypothetical protein G6F70_006238 [Rhizopus microsporus]KAG1209653.1 hypothetical protein G6F69_006162 [Rhizopus microsporus]KAG1231079.1 hypothetical protein G6F67_006005 [Rhizopus microsporus]KAG1263413.1 hypothetical protein G6F68_005172 [Rhizopus microsporus]
MSNSNIPEDLQNDIDNNAVPNSGMQQVVAISRHERSPNTDKTYKQRQDRWLKWCSEKQFTDGALVSERKLVLYLREEILPKGNMTGKKDANGTAASIGKSTIDSHIKSVVDLYRQQRALKINHEDHPRGSVLKAFLKTLKYTQLKRKRKNLEDNVADTPNEDQPSNQPEEAMSQLIEMVKSGFEQLRQLLDQHVAEVNSKLDHIAQTLQQPLHLSPYRHVIPEQQQQQQQQLSTSVLQAQHIPSPPTCSGSNTTARSTYKLCRHLKTVTDVWREYELGLPGQPAVQFLEQTQGTSWRRDRTESRYFSRRKVIYDKVKKTASEYNISTTEAAEIVERKRIELGKSLDGFCKVISSEL